MKAIMIFAALMLAGCGGGAATVVVKCPISPPDAPALTWEGELPKTEIELQQEFLKLKAAYEETAEAESAWRSLWGKC